MADTAAETPVQTRCIGDTAIIYASDYLNKLSGERIERECKRQLELGCTALVINFRDTELVNSIGVSILMGVIDAAERLRRGLLDRQVLAGEGQPTAGGAVGGQQAQLGQGELALRQHF